MAHFFMEYLGKNPSFLSASAAPFNEQNRHLEGLGIIKPSQQAERSQSNNSQFGGFASPTS